MPSTGLDVRQLRDLVVRPVLRDLDLWSLGAEALVLGTAAQESQFRYLHQMGAGPALGLWQMEPATYRDHWTWINARPAYARVLRATVSAANSTLNPCPDPREMCWNLAFAAAMCRVHYFWQPFEVPQPDDVEGLAHVWKIYYNSILGAGLEGQFIANFRNLVAPYIGA